MTNNCIGYKLSLLEPGIAEAAGHNENLLNHEKEVRKMAAIVKVIEILAESTESWEAATKAAVAEAAKTVRNIQNVYIVSLKAIVEDNLVVRYRVDAKITFIVEN